MHLVLQEHVEAVERVNIFINLFRVSQDLRNMLNGGVVTIRVHEDEILSHQNSNYVRPVFIVNGNSTEPFLVDSLHHFSV